MDEELQDILTELRSATTLLAASLERLNRHFQPPAHERQGFEQAERMRHQRARASFSDFLESEL